MSAAACESVEECVGGRERRGKGACERRGEEGSGGRGALPRNGRKGRGGAAVGGAVGRLLLLRAKEEGGAPRARLPDASQKRARRPDATGGERVRSLRASLPVPGPSRRHRRRPLVLLSLVLDAPPLAPAREQRRLLAEVKADLDQRPLALAPPAGRAPAGGLAGHRTLTCTRPSDAGCAHHGRTRRHLPPAQGGRSSSGGDRPAGLSVNGRGRRRASYEPHLGHRTVGGTAAAVADATGRSSVISQFEVGVATLRCPFARSRARGTTRWRPPGPRVWGLVLASAAGASGPGRLSALAASRRTTTPRITLP